MKKILVLFILGLSMTGCYTQMAVNDKDTQEYQDYYAANNNSEQYSGDEGVVYDTVYYDDDEYLNSESSSYKGLEDRVVNNYYIDNVYVDDPFWNGWNNYWRMQAWWSPSAFFDGFIICDFYPRPYGCWSPYYNPLLNPYWDPFADPFFDPYLRYPYWGGGYYGGTGVDITKTHPGHTRNNDGGRNSGEHDRKIREIREVNNGKTDIATRNRTDRGTVTRNDDKRVSREREILNDRNISTNRLRGTGVDRNDTPTTTRDRNINVSRDDNNGTRKTKEFVRTETKNQVDVDRNTTPNRTDVKNKVKIDGEFLPNRTETNSNDNMKRQRKTIYVKRDNGNTQTNSSNEREYKRYTGQSTNNGSTSRTNTNITTERKRETRNDTPQTQYTQPPVRNDYTPPVRNDGGSRSSGNSGNSGTSSRNSGNSGSRGRR